MVAAQTAAAYLDNGKRIEVAGNKLFEHFWYVDIDGFGTFESYPNKDIAKYVEPFGLDEEVTFYRGLLKFPGYCNHMKNVIALGLLGNDRAQSFEGTTYREFIASLINETTTDDLENKVCKYLGVAPNADIVHRLKWLGFFDDKPIGRKSGTSSDVLLDLMLGKMSYLPHEKDMIIVHIDALAEFPGRTKRATVGYDGRGGDSVWRLGNVQSRGSSGGHFGEASPRGQSQSQGRLNASDLSSSLRAGTG